MDILSGNNKRFNQNICDLQVNYNILVLTLEDRSELWQYKWKISHLSSSVQYIQSYNNLVVISTVISCNPLSKYSVHIPPLCSVQLPNRKWSRGHFCPHGPDLRSAYSRHTGYVPRLRKEIQTSSRPSISAKCRMKSPEDLKWVKLWGSGARPTSISYLCWWPGVEGKFSIEYCIQLSGGFWELYIVWIFISPPRYAPVSSPSVLFLAFLRSEASAVCCGSDLHTCHEKTAVARHNIISAAEREGKACIAVPPPSVYSP